MSRLLVRCGKGPFTPVGAEATLAQDVMNTNVGNYLFQHAVWKSLLTSTTEIVSNSTLSETAPATQEDIDRVNEEFDAFVVPLANAFRPSFAGRLANLTSLVRGLRIPVVVVGVGAQTTSDLDREPLEELRPVVTDFVRAVLDRSASIGVRGDFTRDYLLDLGFPDDSVRVIGCPSLFLNGRDFRLTGTPGPLTPASRLALSVTPDVEGLGRIVSCNVERYPGLDYIAQDKADLELLLWARNPESVDPELPLHTGHRLYREDRARLFLDGWTWIEHLAGYDFAFGTRFHGTVAALLADTPALLLTHDSRTAELADYHEMPRRPISGLDDEDVDAATLHAGCDVTAFNKVYVDRFDRYVAFLEHNGLSHVHVPGEGTDAFDARVRSVVFPPPVRPLWALGAEEVTSRLSWLYENQVFEAGRHREVYEHPFNHPAYRDPASRRAAHPSPPVEKLRTRLAESQRTVRELTRRLDRQEARLRALERAWPQRAGRALARLLRRR